MLAASIIAGVIGGVVGSVAVNYLLHHVWLPRRGWGGQEEQTKAPKPPRGAADPRLVDALESRQGDLDLEAVRRAKGYMRQAAERGGLSDVQVRDLGRAQSELDGVLDHSAGRSRA